MRKLGFIVFVLLVLGGIIAWQRHAVLRSIAGTSIVRGMYSQATIALPKTSGAVSYNIYYGEKAKNDFPFSVRNIPANNSSYHIAYLKKDTKYQYKISALNKAGEEIWWSKVQPIPATEAM
jgi:hypothetical protein